MAILFMEGFDQYASSAEFASNYGRTMSNGNYSSAITIASGRIDGNGLNIDHSWGTWYDVFPTSTATQWVHFAYKPDIAVDSVEALLYAYNPDGTVVWSLYTTAGGNLDFRRGTSTSLGTTTSVIDAAAWTVFTVKVFVHDTTGTVVIKRDGTTELNLSSQDTKAGTQDTVNKVGWVGEAALPYTIDDVVIGDDSGTDMTTPPDDVHIEMLNPDGDGTTNDWTPDSGLTNYTQVDEAPSSDGDTTYVSASTVANKDLYTMGAVTSVDTYYAVQVCYRARKETAGVRELNGTVRSTATETDGASAVVSTDYRWFSQGIIENDPNGGGNWTESAINAMECGVELKT